MVPFKIFSQNIYFTTPTSDSVYNIPYGGSVGIPYIIVHHSSISVYNYYAKLTYPDGHQSNWQLGLINGETGMGGWWVTEGGTYQIQAKAWVKDNLTYQTYWVYREPFSFSVIADPPDTNIKYNVNFQNSFIGVGNTGNIKVNSTPYSSPTNNFSVSQGTTINATAINQTLNYIDYSFSNWSDGSTDVTTTFAPLTNVTYTANFIGKPNFSNRGLIFVGDVGQKIQLSWNEHPNTNVKYKIWRKVKHNGVMGSASLIATVDHGITTYTDVEYAYTSSYTDDLLFYDVKAYYTIEKTSSDDNYVSVFGVFDLQPESKKTKMDALIMITENSLDNYPNPFNPFTIIKYQIVKAGHVTLKVYDTLGREVANLVDKEQASGNYSVNFNASSLSSGVYLYRITANGFMAVKKMILTK